MSKRLDPISSLASKAEERAFWETHDSTGFIDWSKARRVRLPNLQPSTPAK